MRLYGKILLLGKSKKLRTSNYQRGARGHHLIVREIGGH